MTIYRKTQKGQQVLKDRSVALLSKQRMAFILFDGRKTLNDIAQATRGIGITPTDIETLIDLELIELVEVTPPETISTTTSQASNPIPPSEYQSRYALAYPIAVGLTSALGFRGFKLNLAVESAMGYQDLLTLLPKLVDLAGHNRCRSLIAILTQPDYLANLS